MTDGGPIEEVQTLVRELELVPHPEGGFYRETHRDALLLSSALPHRFAGPRSASTAIYYLLGRDDFSAFHRIASDEVWHHYAGGELSVHVLHQGEHRVLRLGKDVRAGARPQAVVPAGAWFASRIEDGSAFALVGCTVAPGFDFADFELARGDALAVEYPAHEALIRSLTRC